MRVGVVRVCARGCPLWGGGWVCVWLFTFRWQGWPVGRYSPLGGAVGLCVNISSNLFGVWWIILGV